MEINIISFLQNYKSDVLTTIMKGVSYLSHYWGFIIAFIALLIICKKKIYTVVFGLSYGIGVGLNYVLKTLISRARPFDASGLIENLMPSTGYSMPSGHCVSITIIAVFFIYALLQNLNKNWFRQIAVFGSYLFIPLTMFSRMYLGQHFLTDTLAGVGLGLLICFISIQVYRKHILKLPKPIKQKDIDNIKEVPFADVTEVLDAIKEDRKKLQELEEDISINDEGSNNETTNNVTTNNSI